MPDLPLSPIRTGGRAARLFDHTLNINDLSFNIMRSERRKTLQITVERTGELVILAPPEATERQLSDFVEEKLLWVHTKLEEKKRLQRRAPVKEFVDGEGFLYLGKSYRLLLVDPQLVDLTLKNGRFCLRTASRYRGRDVFISWYMRRAQKWFEARTLEHANRMDSAIKEIRVQDLGFRWGSFGSDGRIFFHWKAILLPPKIAQYVIIHELAHAHHPNHSTRFWTKVEQHLPDWRARKAWLAENGMQVEGL